MTAIAYRDGIIAADTNACTDDIVVGQLHKIAKRGDAIAGATGTSIAVDSFLRSFMARTDKDFRLEDKDAEDFQGIIVEQNGTIWNVEASGKHPITAPFFALGAARGILIGAMAAGASAEEAVRIAIQYDCLCGGEVETYALDTEK